MTHLEKIDTLEAELSYYKHAVKEIKEMNMKAHIADSLDAYRVTNEFTTRAIVMLEVEIENVHKEDTEPYDRDYTTEYKENEYANSQG